MIRLFSMWIFLLIFTSSNAQKVDFTLKYNTTTNEYEIYGIADFSNPKFFVGGGSQLSVKLPTGLVDYPLSIRSIAGGPWTDNSQIYAPAVDEAHDYHGIATNGTPMSFKEGEETMLFTFQLPDIANKEEVRLFDNMKDPNSKQKGMEGADFFNFYACALTMKNVYNGIYGQQTNDIELEEDLTTSIIPIQSVDFELHQNYPNPYQKSTNIGFVLPSDSPITLTLTNEAGSVIKVLKENRKAGYNTFQLTEKDLPVGLIHYQLETKFGTKTKKMLQLK